MMVGGGSAMIGMRGSGMSDGRGSVGRGRMRVRGGRRRGGAEVCWLWGAAPVMPGSSRSAGEGVWR